MTYFPLFILCLQNTLCILITFAAYLNFGPVIFEVLNSSLCLMGIIGHLRKKWHEK